MYHFCTIASIDYLPFVETLYHSLNNTGSPVTLHALVVNGETLPASDGIKWYTLDQLSADPLIEEVVSRYHTNGNALRWSLKPFFLSFLVDRFEKVIYLDNDIFFFNRFDFLFGELEKHTLLLTPHWSSFEPLPHFDNFLTSFQLGLFNAGFVGATKRGKATLQWWGRLCLHRMETDPTKGLFVDQRYLDLAPIYDPEVGILRHEGCNISSVNMHQNRRVKIGEDVLINGTYPIVFIHFSGETVKHIQNGNDGLLLPYFKQYENVFSLSGHSLNDFKHDLQPSSFPVVIKRKLRLRTRVKQAIFRLWQKL
jgi:hypothetical protein